MPELPEVETIRTQLSHSLPFQVRKVSVSKVYDSIIHTGKPILKDVTFESVDRKGKMLIFNLSDGRKLLSHLGMTGAWRVTRDKLNEKHNHLILKGDEGFLNYIDPRRFGHMYLYSKEEAFKKLSELGVDIASSDFTLPYLKQALLHYPNRHLKVTLLDQKLFAGTGNYIANEICALAKIHPERLVCDIRPSEFKKIHDSTVKVITGAIASNGVTFQGGYQDTTGSKGQGVMNLVVFYQKTCQMCKKTKVQKIFLAQRGTYFCPSCQK